MSQNIPDESQIPAEQPSGADLLEKMSESTAALIEAQEKLVKVAADVAKHTTDPNAHGAATLANIIKALPTPVLEDGMFSFKDADGNDLIAPVNLKGETGEKGEKGDDGDKGDMPDHQWNGTSLQIQKPDGSWGEAQDLRGPKGEDGTDGTDGAPGQAPDHQWDGTSLQFKNPDGTWGEAQDLKGEKGAMPAHQWSGTSLQFKNSDGSWGEPKDLQGPKGDPGDTAVATNEQPGIVQPDDKSVTVDDNGILSALGGNLQFNRREILTASGTWIVPVTGWYNVTKFDGGQSGRYDKSTGTVSSGMGGTISNAILYLIKDAEIPYVIGAGGASPTTLDGTYNNGGSTTFGEFSFDVAWDFSNMNIALTTGSDSPGTAIGGAGLSGGYAWGSSSNKPQQEINAGLDGRGCYGGGGGASRRPGYWVVNGENPYAVGAGAQGCIIISWFDPDYAAGPAVDPEPAVALMSARRMAPRALDAPATVNLYDPETGQGSVWRAEDAEAKFAEGLITEEAWLDICAEKAAEERAAWLANPDTETERFAMLRAARDARLAATDYLVAPDYPLSDAQRAAVTAYRQALRDLPAEEGAPWDGGGELTPWPEAPTVGTVTAQPDEPEQTEEAEV